MKKIFIFLTFLTFSVFAEKAPERIISLAPSITEVLCSLNLQKKIVGATDFCIDPYSKTDFKEKSIGSLLSPNFEKIIKLKPDVILSLKGKSSHTVKLRQFGLKVIELNHVDIDGIMSSISKIGKLCLVETYAKKLTAQLQEALSPENIANGQKVLITITRLSSQSNIRLWVAGNDGFYSKLLEACGAENAYTGNKTFEQVSAESLIRTNPDSVIYITNEISAANQQVEKKFWKEKLSTLKAVRNNKYFIITGDEMLIPGPRFPSILSKFKTVLKK